MKVPPASNTVRAYHLTSADYAISAIALSRLKVGRISEVNDPFELFALNSMKQPIRRALTKFKKICENDVIWYHLRSVRFRKQMNGGPMAKVTGIGGVFFKSTGDHKKLAEWYSKNLGIQLEPWGGAVLNWTDDKAADGGVTAWHVAAKNTEWFSPSASTFMINYRVDNMTELLAQLRGNGVDILKGPDSDDNGTFAWILDPDGNKVELWQPK